MFCKYCGNMISDTSRFCDYCGRPTSEGNLPVDFEQKRTIEENRKKNIVGLILSVFAGLMVLAAIMVAINGPDSSNDNRQQAGASSSISSPDLNVSIAEAVVYDENNIKITVTGIDNNSFWGKEIKFLVENNTSKNISVSGSTFVVNGITIYGAMNINVAAGKKANDSLIFMSANLEAAGIEEIATIDTYDLQIFDTDNYNTLHNISLSVKTSISGTYTQPIDESGDVVFERSGITVVAQIISDSIYGKAVRLLVKNNTGKNIIVQAENISVNGFTISAWMYDQVCQDTVRFCDLNLYSSSLEENDITEIEEVTFSLKIIESNTYDAIVESGELKVFAKE